MTHYLLKGNKAGLRIYWILFSLILAFSLVACQNEGVPISTNQKSNPPIFTESPASSASKTESTAIPSAPPEPSSGTISVPKQEPPTVQIPPLAKNVPPIQSSTSNICQTKSKEGEDVEHIQVLVGDKTFTATLAENTSVEAFVDFMKVAPVVVHMRDYSGFEKVGDLETDLPTSNNEIATQSGDIVLYNGNQIVLFYGAHRWSYTRLGKIDDLFGFEEALGSGDVTVTFSII